MLDANDGMYCTCVVLGTVWILVSNIVVFSGEPESSVFIHSRAGLRLQLQMDGVVGGSVLQDILINYEMLLLPPVLYLDVQERMSLTGHSIDLLQPQPELTYQTQTSETSSSLYSVINCNITLEYYGIPISYTVWCEL